MIWTKNFANLTSDEVLQVYKARTHPSTLAFSNTNFSFEEHLGFVKSLKFRSDRVYLMVFDDNEFIGVISFVDIENGSAEFGVYKNPDETGVGDILMQEIIKQAKNLNINSILASVLKNNPKAIHLYEKFGFNLASQDDKFLYLKLNLD